MCPHVRRIHRQQRLDVLDHLGVEPEHRRNLGEHLVVGAIQRPPVMSLPHRLPRSEIGRQVPPRAAGAEPPCDPFQDQPVITEPVAPLACPSSDGITDSTAAQNSSEITPIRVTGQSSLVRT